MCTAWPDRPGRLSAVVAAGNEDLREPLRARRQRVDDLKNKLKAVLAAKTGVAAAGAAAGAAWGTTPQQVQDVDRIAVTIEALEGAVESQDPKTLKFSGFIEPRFIWNKNQQPAG